MRIVEEVEPDNLREVAKKFRTLGNPLRLNILLVLDQNGPKTSAEIHTKLKGGYVHRENSYQALEKLVQAGILKKGYNQEKKKFYYSIK